MQDLGLLYGLSEGLKAGFKEYKEAKKDALDRKMKEKLLQVQMAQHGIQGIDQETGDITYTPEKQRSFRYEDPASEESAAAQDIAIQYLKQTNPNFKEEESSGLLGSLRKMPASAFSEKNPIGGLMGKMGTYGGLMQKQDAANQAAKERQGTNIQAAAERTAKVIAAQKERDTQKKEEKREQQVAKDEKPKKASQPEQMAALYGSRMLQASQDLDKVMKTFDPTSMKTSIMGFGPSYFQSENQKLYEQAKRNFINAALRRESGAAIADSEFKSANAQYFPQAGDTPAVLEQKRRNRNLAIEGFKQSSGSAWTGVYKDLEGAPQDQPDIFPKKLRKGNQQITVSNPLELSEAQKEGWQ